MEGARAGLARAVPGDRDDVLRQVVDALGDGLSQTALAGRLAVEEGVEASRKFALGASETEFRGQAFPNRSLGTRGGENEGIAVLHKVAFSHLYTCGSRVQGLVEGLLTAALLISSALILSRGEDGLSSVLRLGLSVGFLALAVFLGFRLLRSITAAERRPSE